MMDNITWERFFARADRKEKIAWLNSLPPDAMMQALHLSGFPLAMTEEGFRQTQEYLRELDRLPTVQKGLRELGMQSVLDWFWDFERISRQKSPYTHPEQQPYFYCPGLRAQGVYDASEFDWLPKLQAAAPAIREEVIGLLGDERSGFQPYRVIESGEAGTGGTYARGDDHVTEGPCDWTMFYLWNFQGKQIEESCRRCPKTVAALQAVPRLCTHGSFPPVFSAANPGLRISPHHGTRNSVVVVHLCLREDPDCFFRVGREMLAWREGEAFVFDDSFQHEVCHRGSRTRIVLLFAVYHPDWTDAEAARLAELDKACVAANALFRDTDRVREQDAGMFDGERWWK